MSKLEQTRIGFGGPWQRGKSKGQLPLFMIYRLYYDHHTDAPDNPCMGIVLFNSIDWIGF